MSELTDEDIDFLATTHNGCSPETCVAFKLIAALRAARARADRMLKAGDALAEELSGLENVSNYDESYCPACGVEDWTSEKHAPNCGLVHALAAWSAAKGEK